MKMNQNQLNALLKMASKKLGTTPEELQNQLQNGNFQNALNNMPQKDSQKLQQALNNPQMAEKMLSTPQAQAIYKKLIK
ncbi:MAG: hypothetical protein GX896_03060 [Clostridiales bacterium]|nr:hypothetical protein [Clostridiales bacterium]